MAWALLGALFGAAVVAGLPAPAEAVIAASAEDQLAAAGEAVFPLLTAVAGDAGEPAGEGFIEGTGTVLFDSYVVTVAHAVTPGLSGRTGASGRDATSRAVPARTGAGTTWLVADRSGRRVPLEPLARSSQADVAVFRLPAGENLPSLPYPPGDDTALQMGDAVAILGKDPVAGPLFRPGVVAALRSPLGETSDAIIAASIRSRSASIEGALGPGGPPPAFLISLGLLSGESGSPILAMRRGGYQLVGLAQGTFVGPRQLAWAIRLLPALRSLAQDDPSPGLRSFLARCGALREDNRGPGR